jgi:S1-C subfamily serine protease
MKPNIQSLRARIRPIAAVSLFAWLALLIAGPAAGQPRPVTPRGELSVEEKATIGLFEKARDSVVFIATKEQVRNFWTRNVFSVPRGNGSGFLWDEAGHVVTNFHVIKGASEATVRLADGSDHPAALVGVSPAHDLAVLRIDAGRRPGALLPLGSSQDLRVGQGVFAIGNPFGLDWTLTRGIISALDRSLEGETGLSIEHLIQTDAAINPGNSGGPLLDTAGRLIGINTAIFSPSGGSAGIGFAVPVDTVNRVVPQIIRNGKYSRPSMGIELDEAINQRLTAMLELKGVAILRVRPGTPAAAAGLQGASRSRKGIVAGDVITAIDGRSVDSVGKFAARLDEYKAGDRIRLTYVRQGKPAEVSLTLQRGE